ncbi:MAG: hypothetical protein Q9191_003090 [Dirinaria sp. TL-2023a]
MSVIRRYSTNLHRYCSRQNLWKPAINRSHFHTSAPLAAIKPYILADIGEGIKEVQIIQWFVEPEARIEQFDKICEVQSDKAAVDITSRFDGVIKKLHYQADDMVQVGKALCDVDVQGDISAEDEAVITPPGEQAGSADTAQQPQKAVAQHVEQPEKVDHTPPNRSREGETAKEHGHLATPAVRGLLKELDVDISEVTGTGRDGRVLKEDVHKFTATRDAEHQPQEQYPPPRPQPGAEQAQAEETIKLNPTQSQMFKTMTRSLSIPHFVYADEIDVTALSSLRQRLKTSKHSPQKISYMPFIIKAVSLALNEHPLFNARIDLSDPQTPNLVLRRTHNIGIAIDTPHGLVVPNIKDIHAHSLASLATELSRLQRLAQTGKLAPADLAGGTITISNIGSIGGTYVSPVIVQGEVVILGLGRARTVPAFGEEDGEGELVRKEVMNFSWSADHRVVDGATMARMAQRVKGFIQEPATMLAEMR